MINKRLWTFIIFAVFILYCLTLLFLAVRGT